MHCDHICEIGQRLASIPRTRAHRQFDSNARRSNIGNGLGEQTALHGVLRRFLAVARSAATTVQNCPEAMSKTARKAAAVAVANVRTACRCYQIAGALEFAESNQVF